MLKVEQLSRLELNQFLGSAGISSSPGTGSSFPQVAGIAADLSDCGAAVAHHCRVSRRISVRIDQTIGNILYTEFRNPQFTLSVISRLGKSLFTCLYY